MNTCPVRLDTEFCSFPQFAHDSDWRLADSMAAIIIYVIDRRSCMTDDIGMISKGYRQRHRQLNYFMFTNRLGCYSVAILLHYRCLLYPHCLYLTPLLLVPSSTSVQSLEFSSGLACSSFTSEFEELGLLVGD